jgi:hypothetical protein
MFRNKIIFLLSGLLLLLSACAPAATQEPPTPTSTLAPIATNTTIPTAMPTESGLLTWEEIKDMVDEDIFARIGIPNPADYRLSQELQAYKVLRNEDGTNYALFQDLNGNVLLAQNLETEKIEHAAYAEYEENGLQGVPILILNDESLGSAWIGLDSNDPEAQDRLALAFNTALGIGYWSKLHPEEKGYMSNRWPMPSLEELGETPVSPWFLTNKQRMDIANQMRERLLQDLAVARETGNGLELTLRDRDLTKVDLTRDLIVLRMVESDEYDWYPDIFRSLENFPSTGITTILTERDGLVVTTVINLPSFSPDINFLKPVGGLITALLRFHFTGNYVVDSTSYPNHREGTVDLTGPILEQMCMPGAIPAEIFSWFDGGRGRLMWNFPIGVGGSESPDFADQATENCAVQYQH